VYSRVVPATRSQAGDSLAAIRGNWTRSFTLLIPKSSISTSQFCAFESRVAGHEGKQEVPILLHGSTMLPIVGVELHSWPEVSTRHDDNIYIFFDLGVLSPLPSHTRVPEDVKVLAYLHLTLFSTCAYSLCLCGPWCGKMLVSGWMTEK